MYRATGQSYKPVPPSQNQQHNCRGGNIQKDASASLLSRSRLLRYVWYLFHNASRSNLLSTSLFRLISLVYVLKALLSLNRREDFSLMCDFRSTQALPNSEWNATPSQNCSSLLHSLFFPLHEQTRKFHSIIKCWSLFCRHNKRRPPMLTEILDSCQNKIRHFMTSTDFSGMWGEVLHFQKFSNLQGPPPCFSHHAGLHTIFFPSTIFSITLCKPKVFFF